jgi:hypothetical protein
MSEVAAMGSEQKRAVRAFTFFLPSVVPHSLSPHVLYILQIFEQTCGMYPILGPGTPLPLDPGLPPRTQTSPECNCLRPTTQLSNVVFPHPLAPRSP